MDVHALPRNPRLPLIVLACILFLALLLAVVVLASVWMRDAAPPLSLEAMQRLASRDPAVALAEAETQLDAATSEEQVWYALTDAAYLNAQVGNLVRATNQADQLLTLAASRRHHWNYGNAVHKANLALGLVALKSGNREAANNHLLAAARIPGSPQLNSFGPNMLLAQQLFQAGERDALIEYLDLCTAFWQFHQNHVPEWSALIQANVEPDFGANLYY